jgi:UDP-galactopyranose mutase
MNGAAARIFCFSHLRWDFVYQRPQHVMSRLAAQRSVTYWEEPKVHSGPDDLDVRSQDGVTIVTPYVNAASAARDWAGAQQTLLEGFAGAGVLDEATLWYYTPLALRFTEPYGGMRVYDCMDELSAFKDAPPDLLYWERRLLDRCRLVFTGGRSLYEAKRRLHPDVHCFPSAVDADHFRPAARPLPKALAGIARPRAGFYGVIDERFDTAFLAELAALLPEWNFVIVGPAVKIDPAGLPQGPNLHYVGMQPYDELPAYLEHWDVALLPFARNAATRFISPTKTLEYLAAYRPVVSTPIADVISPYGERGLVNIAETALQASQQLQRIVATPPSPAWLAAVRRTISAMSWDATVACMESLLASGDAGEVLSA